MRVFNLCCWWTSSEWRKMACSIVVCLFVWLKSECTKTCWLMLRKICAKTRFSEIYLWMQTFDLSEKLQNLFLEELLITNKVSKEAQMISYKRDWLTKPCSNFIFVVFTKILNYFIIFTKTLIKSRTTTRFYDLDISVKHWGFVS